MMDPKRMWSAVERLFLRLELSVQDRGISSTLLILYGILNVFMFLLGATEEISHKYHDLRKVTLPIGRGFGFTLNLNCALILVPSCRALMTALQSSRIGSLVEFEKATKFHMLVAFAVIIGSIGHGSLQTANFVVLSLWNIRSGIYSGAVLFGTGVALVVVLALIFLLSRRGLRENWRLYEMFWISHLLGMFVFFICLIIHGQHNAKLVTWYYVTPVLVIYACDVMYRILSQRKCTLYSENVLPRINQCGDVLLLKVPVQPSFRAGQYFQIRIPEVSRLEWHPFSPASAPSQDSLLFVIKRRGNWTAALFNFVGETRAKVFDLYGFGDSERVLNVHLRGPFGSPAEQMSRFEHVLAIGAGVGATPMTSVVQELMLRCPSSATERNQQGRIVHPENEWNADLASTSSEAMSSNLLSFAARLDRPHKCCTNNQRVSSKLVRRAVSVLSSVTMSVSILWLLLTRLALLLFALAVQTMDFSSSNFSPYTIPALNITDLVLCSLVSTTSVLVFIVSIVCVSTHATVPWYKKTLAVSDVTLLVLGSLTSLVLAALSCGLGKNAFVADGGVQLAVLVPFQIVLMCFRLYRCMRRLLAYGSVDNLELSETESLDFVWVMPSSSADRWLLKLLSEHPPKSNVRLKRFITQAHFDESEVDLFCNANEESDGNKLCTDTVTNSCLSNISTTRGRPDWSKLISELVSKTPSNGVIGVFCCGPPSLCRSVAFSCREAAHVSSKAALHFRKLKGEFVDSSVSSNLVGGACEHPDDQIDEEMNGSLALGLGVRVVFRQEVF